MTTDVMRLDELLHWLDLDPEPFKERCYGAGEVLRPHPQGDRYYLVALGGRGRYEGLHNILVEELRVVRPS
jgi:hypothetical protein